MTKIAIIIDSLTGGGAERSSLMLAGGFARRGIETHLISIYPEVNYQIPSEVHHHILENKKNKRIKKVAKALSIKIKILENDKPFDLVLTNLSKASEATKKANIKNAYYYVRNSLSDQIQKTNPFGLKKYRKRRLKKIYDGVNVITISDGIKDDLLNTIGAKPASIQTIPNGFDLNAIRAQAEKPLPEAEHLKPFSVHVGHFKNQKRIDVLLEAWTKIDQNLVLVGDGSRRKLERYQKMAKSLGINQRVFFVGWHENSYAWMKQSELLVMSSDFEGFGRVLVEALAVGTPVVSTNCPSGPAEILQGDWSQWLVPTGDAGALAEKINEALQVKPKPNEDIVDRFQIDSIIERHLTLLTAKSIKND